MYVCILAQRNFPDAKTLSSAKLDLISSQLPLRFNVDLFGRRMAVLHYYIWINVVLNAPVVQNFSSCPNSQFQIFNY